MSDIYHYLVWCVLLRLSWHHSLKIYNLLKCLKGISVIYESDTEENMIKHRFAYTYRYIDIWGRLFGNNIKISSVSYNIHALKTRFFIFFSKWPPKTKKSWSKKLSDFFVGSWASYKPGKLSLTFLTLISHGWQSPKALKDKYYCKSETDGY